MARDVELEGLREMTISEPTGEEYEEVDVEKISANDLIEYARYGEVDILKELVNQGLYTRLCAVDTLENTMLHMFAANGHLDCIRYIVQYSPDLPSLLDAQNAEGNTALHWACIAGQLAACQLLLLHGAKVAIENKVERTPICEAHKHNRMDILGFFEEFLGKKAIDQAQTDEPIDSHETAEK